MLVGMEPRPPKKPYRRLKKQNKGLPGWVALVVVVVALGAGGWWFTGHRAAQQMEEFTRTHGPLLTAGQDFGEGKDHRACFADVLATTSTCQQDDPACFTANKAFLVGCMETATVDAFCDVAPRFPSSQHTWARKQCSAQAEGGCDQVLLTALAACRM